MHTLLCRAFVATTATFTASLSGLAAAASPSPSSYSSDDSPGEVPYKYTPPLRVSETLRAAAVQASKPRIRVPTKPKPRVLFVLGGPGAGKGTQCALLASEYGFVHLSAGDLLREERLRGGPQAELIESTIREGKIVPVEITVRLIKAAMDASEASKLCVCLFFSLTLFPSIAYFNNTLQTNQPNPVLWMDFLGTLITWKAGRGWWGIVP